MKHLLAASALVLAFAVPAKAAIIENFGLDPTSAVGQFSHNPAAGAFSDQYTFTLDQSMTLTIASVTNVFAQPSDFITGFTGEVIAGTPALPGAIIIGPVAAGACFPPSPFCQGFAGAAFLNSGAYFLEIFGTAGATSGYGGDLATFAATPLPASIGFFAAGLAGLIGLARRRKKNSSDAVR